ncbi:MAG: CHAT domain-containing protein, partial [Caldilineaceae bacterium]
AEDALAEVRRRLHWLYNQLLGEGGSRGLDAALTRTLVEAEAQLQSLEWEQARVLSPAGAERTQTVTLPEFQAALGGERQAIAYAVAGDELLAFVVSFDEVRLFRHLCSVAELTAASDELRFQLGRAALGDAYVARHGRRLEEGLRQVLARLYALAVAPLNSALTSERLLVLSAGPLHGLPMHAFRDESGYLVERFEIAVAPSASLATQAAVDARTDADAAAPWRNARWAGLALNDPTIPAARREVEQAAAHFDKASLYLDDDAGIAGLHEAAGADVLHVATHGLFRADNPFFSVLKLADGWADVRALYELPLAARLVVLSACESGAGQVAAGEEVIGLARGFLGAGARSLVATIWHVHDESAVRLMMDFYAALTVEGAAPVRPAAALRSAQRAAIAEEQHPWYWAPYYVIGA